MGWRYTPGCCCCADSECSNSCMGGTWPSKLILTIPDGWSANCALGIPADVAGPFVLEYGLEVDTLPTPPAAGCVWAYVGETSETYGYYHFGAGYCTELPDWALRETRVVAWACLYKSGSDCAIDISVGLQDRWPQCDAVPSLSLKWATSFALRAWWYKASASPLALPQTVARYASGYSSSACHGQCTSGVCTAADHVLSWTSTDSATLEAGC